MHIQGQVVNESVYKKCPTIKILFLLSHQFVKSNFCFSQYSD